MEENMNRFKKEVRKKGVKLENDYIFMPINVGNNLVLESVIIETEKAKVSLCYTCGVIEYKMDRSGNLNGCMID